MDDSIMVIFIPHFVVEVPKNHLFFHIEVNMVVLNPKDIYIKSEEDFE